MSEIGESDPETELEIARLSPDGKVVTTMMAFDVLGEDNKSVETDATPDSLSSPVRIDCVRILDTAAARESLPGWPFGKCSIEKAILIIFQQEKLEGERNKSLSSSLSHSS